MKKKIKSPIQPEFSQEDLVNLVQAFKVTDAKDFKETCYSFLNQFNEQTLVELMKLYEFDWSLMERFLKADDPAIFLALIEKLSPTNLLWLLNIPAVKCFGLSKANPTIWGRIIAKLDYQEFSVFWRIKISNVCKFKIFEQCLRYQDAKICQAFIAKMPLKAIIAINPDNMKLADLSLTLRQFMFGEDSNEAVNKLKKFIDEYRLLKYPEKNAIKKPAPFLDFLRSLADLRTTSTLSDRLFLIDAIERAIKRLEDSLDEDEEFISKYGPATSKSMDFLKGSLSKLYYSLINEEELDPPEKLRYKQKAYQVLLSLSQDETGMSAGALSPLALDLTTINGSEYWEAIEQVQKPDASEITSSRTALCDLSHDCHTALSKSLKRLAEVLKKSAHQAMGDLYKDAQTLFLNYLNLDEKEYKGIQTKPALSDWLENFNNPDSPQHGPSSIIEARFRELSRRSARLEELGWPDFTREISNYSKTNPAEEKFFKKLVFFKFQFEIAAGEGNINLSQKLLKTMLFDLEKEISSYFFSSAYTHALERFQLALQKVQIKYLWNKNKAKPTQKSEEIKTIQNPAPLIESPISDTGSLDFVAPKPAPMEVKIKSRPSEKLTDHRPTKLVDFWQEPKNRSSRLSFAQVEREVKDYSNKKLTELEGLLVELGNKIIELDGRSRSFFMAKSARTNLTDKRNLLIELYSQFKDHLAGRVSLEQLSSIIDRYNNFKPMNQFCYFFGTSDTNLFASSYKNNTLSLVHRIDSAINNRLDRNRMLLQ